MKKKYQGPWNAAGHRARSYSKPREMSKTVMLGSVPNQADLARTTPGELAGVLVHDKVKACGHHVCSCEKAVVTPFSSLKHSPPDWKLRIEPSVATDDIAVDPQRYAFLDAALQREEQRRQARLCNVCGKPECIERGWHADSFAEAPLREENHAFTGWCYACAANPCNEQPAATVTFVRSLYPKDKAPARWSVYVHTTPAGIAISLFTECDGGRLGCARSMSLEDARHSRNVIPVYEALFEELRKGIRAQMQLPQTKDVSGNGRHLTPAASPCSTCGHVKCSCGDLVTVGQNGLAYRNGAIVGTALRVFPERGTVLVRVENAELRLGTFVFRCGNVADVQALANGQVVPRYDTERSVKPAEGSDLLERCARLRPTFIEGCVRLYAQRDTIHGIAAVKLVAEMPGGAREYSVAEQSDTDESIRSRWGWLVQQVLQPEWL